MPSRYKRAANYVDASKTLTAPEKRIIGAGIRMAGSDVALNRKDWPAAIAWVQPILDTGEQFLNDDQGAFLLGMSVRQQSMFLVKNGDLIQSSDLIDSTCQKFEDAESVSKGAKLRMLCMLRGKHLLNFSQHKHDERFESGWKKYEALSVQARSYQGTDRAEVLRSCLNMNRLAMYCLEMKNIESAIETIQQAIRLLESEPKLQDARFGALVNVVEMTSTVCDQLGQTDPKRAAELQQELQSRLDAIKKDRVDQLR